MKWLPGQPARQSWEVALNRAERTREPIMAFCFEDGRQLTMMMDAQSFADPEVGKTSEDFLCVRMDVLAIESRPFLDMYDVGRKRTIADGEDGPHVIRHQTFPVTLFLTPDGGLAHIVYGYVIPSDLVTIMSEAMEIVDLLGKLGEDPKDVPSLMRLGQMYVELQRYAAGREALELARGLDTDGTHRAAELALLDLALTYMAAEDAATATALITQHAEAFPNSELRCKAQYLMGGARLTAAHQAEQLADTLADDGDAEGADVARRRAGTNRKEAIDAWAWFEGEHAKCPTDENDWELFSLSALFELRARDAYAPLEPRIEALMEAKDYSGAISELRGFVALKEYKGTEASCGADYLIGECLMLAGKREQALAQWRNIMNRKPAESAEKVGDPCGTPAWRAIAMQAIQGAGAEQ
ncbi:MAG TPA: hypothetical protein QGH10_03220 [Armatimonadota bacterium]|nr:hypothetical protein [Armatimonadota bacterium]